MKRFEFDLSDNPSFSTVTGLTNTTWTGTPVDNRAATEGQLSTVNTVLQQVRSDLETCCSTDQSQEITQNIIERIEALSDQIDTCCTVDHGAVSIENILQEIEDLRTQIQQCCSTLEQRVELVKQGLVIEKEDDSGDFCDAQDVQVSINIDTTPMGSNKYANIGQVIVTNNNPDLVVRDYFFLFEDSTTGKWYNQDYGYILSQLTVKIEGHENTRININGKTGMIVMMQYGSGYANGQFPSNVQAHCDSIIVGPNKQWDKLWVRVAFDNRVTGRYCQIRTELPISAFDFSKVDESWADSDVRDDCPEIRNV